MKSQIFKTAWELFKSYNVTFSQALTEAWKKAKRELLKLEFATIKPNEISYRQRLANKYHSLKATLYTVRDEVRGNYVANYIANHNRFLSTNYENWMQ